MTVEERLLEIEIKMEGGKEELTQVLIEDVPWLLELVTERTIQLVELRGWYRARCDEADQLRERVRKLEEEK